MIGGREYPFKAAAGRHLLGVVRLGDHLRVDDELSSPTPAQAIELYLTTTVIDRRCRGARAFVLLHAFVACTMNP